ncbi:MAG: PAS domain-containing protein [Alphaproteobacteria bacterium]|nr:PAS domain-containing protein [Alphaproteobacteria bacterium]
MASDDGETSAAEVFSKAGQVSPPDPLQAETLLGAVEEVSPEFLPLLDHWSAAGSGGVVPEYRSFDASLFPGLLPRLYVVEERGGRFFYRLAGEEIRSYRPKKMVGATLFDIFDTETAERIEGRWRKVLHTPALCFARTWHVGAGNALGWGARLLLPYRIESEAPNILLGAVTYFHDEESAVRGDYLNRALSIEEIFKPV